MGGILQSAIALSGTVGGVMVGLLFLGILFPHCSYKSAYVSSMTASAFMLWIFIGSRIYPPPPQYHLPRSTEGCATLNGSYLNASSFNGSVFNGSHFNEPRYSIILPEEVVTSVSTTNESSVDRERPAIAVLYALSYQWYAMVAIFIVCLTGILSSFVIGATPLSDVDARLISPLVVHLYCWLSSEQKDLFHKNLELDTSSSGDHEMKMIVHVAENNVAPPLEAIEDGKLICEDR